MIRAGHIFLAVLVYISSIGIVLNSHFCQGTQRYQSIFLPAKRCPSMPVDSHCLMHHAAPETCRGDSMDGDNYCCQDKTSYAKQNQERVIETPGITVSAVAGLPLADALYLHKGADFDRQSLRYLTYKPPPLIVDRVVVLQIFLC